MNVKTVLAVVLVGGALVSLGGCASMSKKGDPSALTQVQGNGGDAVDSAYVQQVDSRAREMGVTVVWVNLPAKSRQ